ncbi:MAG: NADH-quinone oxidoreductase subunit J, partial [Alphaproteobacteria bacterium]
FVLACELFLITKFSTVNLNEVIVKSPTPSNISNTKAIGKILYTDFILPFQLCGAILFVAMIGAIILTMKNEKRFIKKQNIFQQVSRNKENSLKIIKVKAGETIDI